MSSGAKIFNGDIKIFGPRPSGKLTFLVALACLRNRSPNSPVLSIEVGESGKYLIQMGRNILQMGMLLPPMRLDDHYSYCFTVVLRQVFNILNPFDRRLIKLQACYTAYAGEWFEWLFHNCGGNDLIAVIDSLGSASKVILLFDSTTSQRDPEYARTISVLKNKLSKRINLPANEKRYAIVFSKMDLAPPFFYLPDLNNFITIKFPQLFSECQKWSKDWNCSIHYFGCSAFGMVGNPPTPNVKWAGGGLKEPNYWQPFGLVAPIYWLLTGKEEPRLLDYP